jgi:hypothetical protein
MATGWPSDEKGRLLDHIVDPVGLARLALMVRLGACIHPIDKMLSMRLRAGSGCRRAGTGPACRPGGSRSRGRRGPGFGLAAHAGAVDSGEDRCDDVVSQGEQGADDPGAAGRDLVAAG